MCERLEDRCLLATFLVTNTADDGNGSLRQAILSANARPNVRGPDAIRFSIEGDGPHTIHVGSATNLPLPTITDPVSIDGTTDDSAEPSLIELEGTPAGPGANGLTIVAGGSTVRGLAINRFAGHGIRLETGGGNRIVGNYIGTDLSGTLARGNGGAGVSIFLSSDNIIGGSLQRDRNLISGNGGNGVAVISSWPSIDSILPFGSPPLGPPYSGTFSPHSPLAAFNGEDPNGTWTLNVSDTFVSADDGHVRAFSLVLGDSSGPRATFRYAGPPVAVPPPGSDNVDLPLAVSGLGGSIADVNFRIDGTACSAEEGSTTVGVDHTWVGDLIFNLTSPAGTTVTLINSAGGSGNNFCNTLLDDTGGAPPAEGNLVVGNYIGTDITGAAPLGNGNSGVLIVDSPRNRIGGAGAGNLISANGGAGVLIQADENVVAGNKIGTDAAGAAPLGNALGVVVRGRGNRIGTNGDGVQDLGERNLISGNESDGVQILGFDSGPPGGGPAEPIVATELLSQAGGDPAASGDNVVAGNYIGINAAGKAALGNGGAGVIVRDSTVFETRFREVREIVCPDEGDCQEVVRQIPFTVRVFVPGHNRIGTNGDGRADAAERNVVAANGVFQSDGEEPPPAPASIAAAQVARPRAPGIRISGAENIVAGNFIGTDAVGKSALGNGFGVIVTGTRNRIGTNGDGRADLAERNVISGNLADGVQILGEESSGGPVVEVEAASDVAQPEATGEDEFTTRENIVAGNFIGLNVDGKVGLGNGGPGVAVRNGAANRIGTNGDGLADNLERNVISANALDGVNIAGIGNVVAGNLIGADVTGTRGLGNGHVGVTIVGALNRVGTNGDGLADRAERNVISANGSDGVQILDNPFIFPGGGVALALAAASEPEGQLPPPDENVVAGNLIGTDVTGARRLGNAGFGVAIAAPEARGNRIGTDGDGLADSPEGNLISANAKGGVFIDGADDNVVAGNLIGTDTAGLRGLGNAGPGVRISGGFFVTRFRIVEQQRTEQHVRLVCDENGCREELFTVVVVVQIFIPFTAVAGHGNLIGASTVGLSQAAERNIISANAGEGVLIVGAESSKPEPCFECAPAIADAEAPPEDEISLTMETLVAGNLIGTSATGLLPLGNRRAGVAVINATGNQIGGPGLGNTIAFNGRDGVGIRGEAAENRIQANSIHSNDGLGIDLGGDLALEEVVELVARPVFETIVFAEVEIVVLPGGIEQREVRQIPLTVSRLVFEQLVRQRVSDLGGDGVSFNDASDDDSGPNHLQNFPTILTVRRGLTTRVTGSLDSQPDTTFTIDFYVSPLADPSAFGEGARWLGSIEVTTNSQGHAAFDVELPAFTSPTAAISATATDPAGNSSEFSFAPQGSALMEVAGGRLLIVAQGANRAIRIAPGGAGPGSVDITDGSRTTSYAGVTAGIEVSLPRGGADTLFFDGAIAPLTVQGNLDVFTGDGKDNIWALGLVAQGRALFDTGNGDDWIRLVDAVFSDDWWVLMQQGNDTLDLRHCLAQGAARFDMASGHDRVWIDASSGPAGPSGEFRGPAEILAGSGDDQIILGIRPASVAGAAPPASPLLFLDLLTVDGGTGSDRLEGRFILASRRRLLNLETILLDDSTTG